jgi:hypothetical protein
MHCEHTPVPGAAPKVPPFLYAYAGLIGYGDLPCFVYLPDNQTYRRGGHEHLTKSPPHTVRAAHPHILTHNIIHGFFYIPP